jgi:limonene-1,2-epoxide hydrolase
MSSVRNESDGCHRPKNFYHGVHRRLPRGATIGGTRMITENMRNLLGDPQGLDVIRAYLHAIETQDIGALKRLMAPDIELIHANYPPVHGRNNAADMIKGYLSIVKGVEFEVRTVFGDKGCYAVEKVNVARAPNATTARIRVVTILDVGDDNLLGSVRIYADTADLFRKLDITRPPGSS